MAFHGLRSAPEKYSNYCALLKGAPGIFFKGFALVGSRPDRLYGKGTPKSIFHDNLGALEGFSTKVAFFKVLVLKIMNIN